MLCSDLDWLDDFAVRPNSPGRRDSLGGRGPRQCERQKSQKHHAFCDSLVHDYLLIAVDVERHPTVVPLTYFDQDQSVAIWIVLFSAMTAIPERPHSVELFLRTSIMAARR
jgi:hypothetical protein